ncbi:hypothetical protein M0805_000649 [Coniferiporia weirii]|nr:hypothetical protein M0805_000649 [Coniferiporia weirii]
MAYLARRPDTHIIRLLLLPATLSAVLHSCLGYVWTGEGMNVYNWGEGLCCLVCIGKTLEYAFVKEGRFKVGEKHLGGMSTPAISKKDYDPKDPTHPADSHIPVTGLNRPGSSFLPLGLQDGFELAFAFRGVGWDFGKYVYIPPERKPLARRPFLIATLNTFAFNFLVLDFLESCIKLAPRVGTPLGGSIFMQHLPPAERYATSTALHIASGFALLAGFQMVYDLATLVGVGLLQHDPTSWPPVIDRPWAATSLGELWARRWHQLLRQTFIIYGGVPGYAVGGRVGMVLGTFLASGLYHEASSLAMGRGWDPHVVLFFAAQGVLVLLERVWKRVTGKRVCGWPGRVWVYFVIMVLGQAMIDSWHKKGLGGGLIIPPVISPTRKQIFPLISHLTGFDLSVYPL